MFSNMANRDYSGRRKSQPRKDGPPHNPLAPPFLPPRTLIPPPPVLIHHINNPLICHYQCHHPTQS